MPDATQEVFFSYSRSDEALVLKIASALRRDGRRVWVDQLDIAKGARWDDEVEKALKASSCLLAILSPAAVASQNVMDEVSYALGEKKKVIPVVARPRTMDKMMKSWDQYNCPYMHSLMVYIYGAPMHVGSVKDDEDEKGDNKEHDKDAAIEALRQELETYMLSLTGVADRFFEADVYDDYLD